jgi:hypothetical protein
MKNDITTPVDGGVVYRNGVVMQVWWGHGEGRVVETWTRCTSVENAIEEYRDFVIRFLPKVKQSIRMDAADGSFYKGWMKEFAVDEKVSVEQIDEDTYEFSWIGLSWNDIADIVNDGQE